MRVTGRILGLCLAAIWSSAAVCADPALGGSTSLRASPVLDSDAPAPSAGLTHGPVVHPADEPDSDPKSCPGLAAENLQPISPLMLAADLQAPSLHPLSTRHMGNPQGDDMRSAGARAAVMETGDKAAGSSLAGNAAGQGTSLKVRALNEHERTASGLADGGLVITSVDGNAARAGFRTGDVVLMLDGVSLTSPSQFYKLMLQLPADRPVPVLVHRPTSDLFLPLGTPHR